MITQIIKRNKAVAPFDLNKICNAIQRCFVAINKKPNTSINVLVDNVNTALNAKYSIPTVEQIQDIVEIVLQISGEYEAAKAYILYRSEKSKVRDIRPIPDAVKELFKESSKYFPTALQQFQFYDKYARFDYNLGRRETWPETVKRAVKFLREISYSRLNSDIYQQLESNILNMSVMPSMRLLAMGGKPAHRNNLCIYNCSYLPIEDIDCFTEALTISMCGCGVGYSVERKYVENLSRIKRQTNKKTEQFTIKDTAEGWVEALYLGLHNWFNGNDIIFDYSLIRKSGTPLKTKGGRASGPEPLRKMLDYIRNKILSRQGSFLRPIDAHDIMCSIGMASISGGVRRTALISLFDYDDYEMRHCKDNDGEANLNYRWNANNSAVWPSSELTQHEVTKYFSDIVDSQRGEPGIFNRQAVIMTRPERRREAEFGTNPCITSDTFIMTKNGAKKVTDLIGKQFIALVNGEEYLSTEQGFWLSGLKRVYRLKTKEGYQIDITPDHKVLTENNIWSAVDDLSYGDHIKLHNHRDVIIWPGSGTYHDGWLLGSLLGNGIILTRREHYNHYLKTCIFVYEGEYRNELSTQTLQYLEKVINISKNNKGIVNTAINKNSIYSSEFLNIAEQYGVMSLNDCNYDLIQKTSHNFYIGFLRGLFDVNCTISDHHNSLCLHHNNIDIIKLVQNMLLRLGIVSRIYNNYLPSINKSYYNKYSEKLEYQYQFSHKLIIERDNIRIYHDKIGFSTLDKIHQLQILLQNNKNLVKEKFITTLIEKISLPDVEKVYDCSIPDINAFDANGLYIKNCGEIVLRPYELCNLSMVVCRADDNLETLQEKVKLATVIGTIQSMATYFPGLRNVWQFNCEDERLLGVDITGQMDCKAIQDKSVMQTLKNIAIQTNSEIANVLGINQSAAITCVKPSGNSSQLLNCSPGIHTRWSKYYIRNVRVSAYSPIFKVLRDLNIPMDPENGQLPETADTWVIHFPIKSPDGAITRNERTAIEQCEYWLQNKTCWTEHNPSVTIVYKPDEVIDIIKWIWQHQNKIGGMSFLPAFDAQYEQMPYTEITEVEYNRLSKKFPKIDFSKLYRYEVDDHTTAAQELACVSGLCEVI